MQLSIPRFQCFLKSIVLVLFLIGIAYPKYIKAQDIEAMIVAENDSTSYRLKAVENLKKYKHSYDNGDFEQSQTYALKGIRNIQHYNKMVKDSTIYSIVILKSKLQRAYAVSTYYLGEYVESMVFYDRIITNLKLIEPEAENDPIINELKARCYNGKAIIYSNQGIISKALDNFLKALKMNEANNDSAGIARLNNNIGIVYKNQDNYDEAEKYFFRALEIYQNLNDEVHIAPIYNNLGLLYVKENEPDMAIDNLKKAEGLNKKIKSQRSLSHTYHNMGKALILKKNYHAAISSFNKAIEIQKNNHDERALLSSYVSLAELYKDMGNYEKAKQFLKYSEKQNENLHLLPEQVSIYKTYFEIYYRLNQTSKALKYHILFKTSSDSLTVTEQRAEAARIQLSYQLAQKEQELDVANKQRELNEVKLMQNELSERRQTIIIIVIVALLMLALVFVLIIFKRLQENRKQQIIIQNQKMEMDHKNRILKNAYEEINEQKIEIIAQRNKLSGQKDKAFMLFNDLKSSISYAQHIQNALLPDNVQLKEIFDEYFVFNMPHSIVSGDFYWGNKINNWKIFAVADCTGHGVPGALMSMLGITYLNEIVKYKDVNNTAIVLEYLRKYIINSLRNADGYTNNRNGMDIAIIAKKPDTNTIYFSGANANIYLVRESQNALIANEQIFAPILKTESLLLYELKGDRMPIGFDEEMNSFTNWTLEIEPTDKIYFFTDGYADQFGGEDGKKLKYKRFKEIVLEYAKLPMNEQNDKIASFINDWMGKNRQVDDMLVVGGKLKF